MRECKRCGGSALRDYAYGCDHVFDDAPSPLVEIVEVRGESVYHASHNGAAPHVLHPGEVGVREGWREAWRDKAIEDAQARAREVWGTVPTLSVSGPPEAFGLPPAPEHSGPPTAVRVVECDREAGVITLTAETLDTMCDHEPERWPEGEPLPWSRPLGVAVTSAVPINDGSGESLVWVQIGAGTITEERRAELEREAQVRAAALALTPNERAVLRFAACMPGATLGNLDVYEVDAIVDSLVGLGLLTGEGGACMTTALGAAVAGVV